MIVFGGANDFNIGRILLYLKKAQIPHTPIILSKVYTPSLVWDVNSDRLYLDGKILTAQAIFMRRDVFNSTDRFCSDSCYVTLKSWALAHPEVKMFNKDYIGMHKAYNIVQAQRHGLSIPKTLLANKLEAFRALPDPEKFIVKPVSGGQHTQTLKSFFELKNEPVEATYPVVFLQEKLEQPEMRIFYIGGQYLAFNLVSTYLDYREDKNTEVKVSKVPIDLAKKLGNLCNTLNLDYAAADFKTCPKTKRYQFLEVNSGPMFAAFDKKANGELCANITKYLLQD